MIQPSTPLPFERSGAERLYLEFQAARARDPELDFETFCARHPEQARALRILHSLGDRGESQVIHSLPPGVLEAIVGPAPEGSADPISRTRQIQDLAARRSFSTGSSRTYEIRGLLGHGGMSVVLEGFDPRLERSVAIKVFSPRSSSPGEREAASVRFLREAGITSRLEHPDILPIHEVAVDPSGDAFFTMPLVRGRTLASALEECREDPRPWNRTELIRALVRVCQALAYAHSVKVIHRDLKPANIMLGRFGEVYLMDWGLARDLRGPAELAATAPPTSGSDSGETLQGEVLGTPGYIAPEQAAGQLEQVGPAADIYSVGAILYTLLCGRPPHLDPDLERSPREVIESVLVGPPAPVLSLSPRAPAELVKICEKAMARSPGARYSEIGDLERDLQAYLDDRVVQAHRTGTFAELVTWMRRNRGLTASLAVMVALLLAGSLLNLRDRARLEKLRTWIERTELIESIADRTDGNWTRWSPEHLRQGVEELDEMEALLPELHRELARLRERGIQLDLRSPERVSSSLPAWELYRETERRAFPGGVGLEKRTELLEKRLSPVLGVVFRRSVRHWRRHHQSLHDFARSRLLDAGSWVFSDPGDQRLHDLLARRLQTIELLTLKQPFPGRATRLRRHFEALVISEAADWTESRQVARELHEIELLPQRGLVPLGPDPRTGLLEFAHLESGEPAHRSPDGELVVGDRTGLVFVLIPGRYNERRGEKQKPYFVSKYEMTQANWESMTGTNPSHFRAGVMVIDQPIMPRHPVEGISLQDLRKVMRQFGLRIPTIAEWEHAARGGSATEWYPGCHPGGLAGHANLRDRTAGRRGELEEFDREFEDGHVVHAPVGSFESNPYGLHDIHGNVWEWCRGWTTRILGAGTEVLESHDSTGLLSEQPVFGGSFLDLPTDTGFSAFRLLNPETRSGSVGARPIRYLNIP